MEKKQINENEEGKRLEVDEQRRHETDKRKAEKLRKARERRREKRANETKEERELRLAKRREARKKMSDESKGKKLEYERERRQRESKEKRESRLHDLKRRSEERIRSETPDQRERRLEILKRNTAKRIVSETPGQQAARQEAVKRDTAKRIDLDMPEQRTARLALIRENTTERRASETDEEREGRLDSMRIRIENVREKEREERLAFARENAGERRANNVSLQVEQVNSREEYLHQGGWQNTENPLHEQEWVRNEMQSFHSSQEKLEHRQCSICKETWPTKLNLTSESYVCQRCKRDKKSPKVYGEENDMDPGIVPQQLEGLTQIEEMLIARVCPIMSVYKKHGGGQRGYRGHVLNLPQDIESFLNRLPSRVADLPVLVVRKHGADNTHYDCIVRRQRVLEAVLWLKTNNPYFKDIEIDREAIQSLPENGIPDDLRCVVDTEVSACENEEEGPPQETVSTKYESVEGSVVESGSRSSFIPQRQRQRKDEDAIREKVNEQDPLDWPSTEGNVVNEFKTDGLATMAFPTLFPFGKGDPTTRARQHGVTLTEAFKHLIKFSERLPNGKYRWRFASHPRFPYWALDMKQRHQLLSQANVYLRQHPADANLTMEELREMVNSMSGKQMINRLQHFVAKVQGTNQYWYQRLQELLALIEQKGCPTFFFTFSAADSYWPELQRLLQSEEDATQSERLKAVVDNPHLTDWYFKQRLDDFIRHWLKGVMDAEWHWFRFEYQARGSIHAHGCAKLKNDPDIPTLRALAAHGWGLTETMSNEDDFEFFFQEAVEQGKGAEKQVLR